MKNVQMFFTLALLFLALVSCQKERLYDVQIFSKASIQDPSDLISPHAMPANMSCVLVNIEGAATLGNHDFPIYPGSGLPGSEGGILSGWGAKPFPVTLSEEIEGSMASIVTAIRPTGNEHHQGAAHYQLVHYFVDSDHNQFWTNDKAICTPFTNTPNEENDLDCLVNDQLTIVYGTGKFCDATGKLANHGVIDLLNSEVILRIKGRICSPCLTE